MFKSRLLPNECFMRVAIHLQVFCYSYKGLVLYWLREVE